MAAPAAPLDESTLRRVFPDAPASIAAPDSVRTLFDVRVRAFWSTWRTLLLVGLFPFVVVSVYGLWRGAPVVAVVCVGFVAMAVAGIGLYLWSRANRDFATGYATARGLALRGGAFSAAQCVPLLRQGDRREFNHVMAGTIAGQPAQLGRYTYYVEQRRDDGTTTENSYEFTVLHFVLPEPVAARYLGVYLRPGSLSLGRLGDKLSHDRAVKLESAAFNDRYNLRVVDEQDDIALYELFAPQFIELLTREAHVFWEQVGPHLVLYRKGHGLGSAGLDTFCLEGWHVLYRYLQEWQ